MSCLTEICLSGSAFQGNTLQASRLITHLKYCERTNFVSLSEWCERNFITKDLGRKLIQEKLLIAQRLWGRWWVCINLDCLEELLARLEVEEILFDADNQKN